MFTQFIEGAGFCYRAKYDLVKGKVALREIRLMRGGEVAPLQPFDLTGPLADEIKDRILSKKVK
jgi:hypothetical protein